MRFTLDDSIMIKGELATAGSKMLHNFKAPFSAAVFDKLKNTGLEYIGQTRPDEFGAGQLFNDTDDLAEAVKSVADGQCDVALCNDVFGKIRRQAPENGLFYIHPTYGTVSRFGLIPAISSMDQIGVVCRNADDGFATLSRIAGHDENDGTTYPQGTYHYSPQTGKMKIGIPYNVLELSDDKSKQAILAFSSKSESEGFTLKYFDVLHQVRYILGCAEISNNTTRYDGIKFGYRTKDFSGVNELYLKTRTEGFGPDMKLASLMGCMVLSQEHYDSLYLKAMQIRRQVKQHCDKLFLRYDVIALPVSMAGCGPYKQSALHALATLAGLPSVSMPYIESGIQLVAQAKNENALFSICRGGI